MGDLGSIPGLGISPGEGKGYPLPVFWPGEFHELSSPWSCKESETTKQLSLHFTGFPREVETWVSGNFQMDKQAAVQ